MRIKVICSGCGYFAMVPVWYESTTCPLCRRELIEIPRGIALPWRAAGTSSAGNEQTGQHKSQFQSLPPSPPSTGPVPS